MLIYSIFSSHTVKLSFLKMSYLSIFLLLSLLHLAVSLKDPYVTLGVQRSATVPEIKQAYKRLAKEWHPDKNKDAAAEDKFIEINKAYELLMDPERKRLFDRSGVTEDTPNFRHSADYSHFRRYGEGDDYFQHIFSQGGFNFQYKFNQGSFYHQHTITAKAFENHVLPNSNFQPYLILFYGELCFACINAEPIWRKLILELEPLGIGFAAIHAQQEGALAHKIGVSSLPYLIAILDGRAVHYKDHQLSFLKVVDFCRRVIPSRTVVSLSDYTASEFLHGWIDNRVRVIIFSTSEAVRLRYLVIAYRFRSRAAFGHIRIGSSDTVDVVKKYNIQSKMESLLIFNEDASKPIATLSMTELSTQTMADVIEANKFLLLPRLSSQSMFDQLCPAEAKRARKYLCVILITKNIKEHDPYRSKMRNFIGHMDLPSRVRFMFLFEEKQKEFVDALTAGMGAPSDPILHVVMIWRKEQDRVKYQWLDHNWEIDEKGFNATKEELNAALKHIMQTTESLPYDAKVSILADEHALGLFSRIVNRMILVGDVLWDNITRQEIIPTLTIVLSIAFIIAVGYIMSYLVQLEEQSIQEKYQREGKQVPGMPSKKQPEYHLHIHELRGETYNGLVRLLKPGCRTIVLLLDTESKMKLLPTFYRAVYPYRKNKTLMFGFLMVEKNLDWYRKLLLQTLGEPRELNINPKNCIGTVLSLNGHRKYFCVYHAKHAEQSFHRKNSKGKKHENSGAGDFMGFEDSHSESENSDLEAGKTGKIDNDLYGSIIFQEHLLDGLSNWLDRLFEGSTQRYYIQFWPESMK